MSATPKLVKISGRNFVKGKFPCLECGRSFKVLIPESAIYWWSRLCSMCDPSVPSPTEIPKGGTLLSFEEMPKWRR